MQPTQKGYSKSKTKKQSRPNSSNPLSNKGDLNKSRPQTSKTKGYNNTNTKPDLLSSFANSPKKFSMTNTNNNFRSTRPASSARDRVFNKYWENKTPNPENIQNVCKFEYKSPSGENFITNELLVDLNRKQKSIYNRGLYKYTKIDWDAKKTGSFLSSVGGLDIKSNNCLLNTPVTNQDNYSINTTAVASRPQSNTIFTSGNPSNIMSIFGKNRERPQTGIPIKSNRMALNSEKNPGEADKKDMITNLVEQKPERKRPLTGNVLIGRRDNARPLSAISNKMT